MYFLIKYKHSQVKIKKMIEYDEQEEQKHIQSRSRKWWMKVDKRYFKKVGVQQLREIKSRVINQVKLNEAPTILPGYHNNKAHNQFSYFHKNIYSFNSKLFDRRNIRVLFTRNGCQNQGQQDLMCLGYSFGFRYQQQQQVLNQLKENNDECYVISDDDDDKNLPIENQRNSQNSSNFSNCHGIQHKNQIQEQKKKQYTFKKNQSEKFNVQVSYMKQQQPATINSPQQIEKITSMLQLTANRSSSDMQFLTKCNSYDIIIKQYFHTQIQKEIALWGQQLNKVLQFNQDTWSQIQRNLITLQEKDHSQNIRKNQLKEQNLLSEKQLIDQQVNSIHQFLAWQHNLVNFKNGFSDKNQEMLAQALQGMWIKQNQTKNMGDKKKFFKASIQNLMQTKSQLTNTFQTDCKICFSTYVSEKNKVIYCDSCNQSFHEKCYGIVDLNEDPNSKFYCDACQFVMNSNNKKTGYQPSCQICHVDFSPLKNINGRYFHPSCLFLNNLLKPSMGSLRLDQQITTQTIISKVKQIQLHNDDNECEFCMQKSRLGLRFKCAQSQCTKYFHTICAYVHSNVFKIWRNKQKLQMQIRCCEHFPGRDKHRQAYLRRFFCNFKNIADLTQNQFIQIYNEEIECIKEYKLQQKTITGSILQSQNIENNQYSNSMIRQKSSKKKHYDDQPKEKLKKKHKKKQKVQKEFKEIKDFIDLNSDDQENTDCQNNSLSQRYQKKTTTRTENLIQNQKRIQQQFRQNNAQILKQKIQKLQNQLIKKKRRVQNSTSSSQRIIDISKYLQNIDENFGQQSNSLNDYLSQKYQINVQNSFQESIIYE